jgi:hypothetical protein
VLVVQRLVSLALFLRHVPAPLPLMRCRGPLRPGGRTVLLANNVRILGKDQTMPPLTGTMALALALAMAVGEVGARCASLNWHLSSSARERRH